MKIIKAQKDDFKKEVLESKIPVLIDFNADWCGPCRMLTPILEEIAKEKSTVKFVSINVDENEELAKEYHIFSIPCLVLIKNGKEIERTVGLKSKEELEKLLGEKYV